MGRMQDAEPRFELSSEELTGTFKLPADVGYGAAYVDAEIKDVRPAVDFLSAPPAGMVAIYRAVPDATKQDLIKWGEAARAAVDASLDETGVVLLRGIPAQTEEEFSEFWKGCRNAPGRSPWGEASYVNMGRSRKKVAGIDTATNIPPEIILNTHNELSYNPIPLGRIALFCLQVRSNVPSNVSSNVPSNVLRSERREWRRESDCAQRRHHGAGITLGP